MATLEGTMRARIAVILVAVVLAAGCGDDTDDAGGSGGDSTTSSSSDDGSTVDAAADQQAAEDAVLVLSDMPAGWVDSDDDADEPPDDSEVAAASTLADCLGVDVSMFEADETDGEPTADSEFESPEDLSVRSEVQVNPTVSEGEDLMAAITADGATACFHDGFAAAFEASDLEGLGEISVEQLDFDAVGDQSTAFRFTVPFETDGGTVVFLMDSVTATKGRATVDMTFISYSEPWDASEALRLTEIVLDRIPSDL